MATVYLNTPGTFNGDMNTLLGGPSNWLQAILGSVSNYTVLSVTPTAVTLKVTVSAYAQYTVVLTPQTVFSASTNPIDPFLGAIVSLALYTPEGVLVSTLTDLPANTYIHNFGDVAAVIGAGSMIVGSGGADIITAFNIYPGNTLVDGGAGADTLYGAKQVGFDGFSEIFVGGPGDDKIYAYGGDDDIYAGDGADYIDAGAGIDYVYLAETNSSLQVYLNTRAPTGAIQVDNAEIVFLNDAGSFVQGGATVDAVIGGAGGDVIHGAGGDDLIAGLEGDDRLFGDDGDDLFDAGDGDDLIDGGAGFDSVDYSAASSGVSVDLAITTAQVTGQGSDRLVSVEGVVGGQYRDSLYGDSADNTLYGVEGGDLLFGRGGADYLDGGDGEDRLDGGEGDDLMIGSYGDDTYWVDSVNDIVLEFTGEGRDTIITSIDWLLDDSVEELRLINGALLGYGNDLSNTIYGNANNNILSGGFGVDTLNGGGGQDIYEGTLAELSGDRVAQFKAGDSLHVVDLAETSYVRTATGLTLRNGANISLGGSPNGVIVTLDGLGGVKFTAEAQTATLGDFDGDGRTDLAWRDIAGTLTTWGMDVGVGGRDIERNIFIADIDPGWLLAAAADFDSDGRADLLLRSVASGTFSIWTSTGQGFTQNRFVDSGATPDWKLAATGDFDGDGASDMIWRNDAGVFAEWQGGAGGFERNVYVNGGVSAQWRINVVGDFNGDAKDDLLWRNLEGHLSVWTSNGDGFDANTFTDFTVDPTWHLLAADDFNGDGKDDLLWRHDSGMVTQWTSNGQGFNKNAYVNTDVDWSWTLGATGDFDGDGKADLLWRNDQGVTTIWSGVAGGFAVNTLVDSTVSTYWQLAAKDYDLV